MAMIKSSLIWCFTNAICASAICAPYQINTITLSGNQAPGTPNGQVFSSFHMPTINDKGQTAFTAFLRGAGANAANNSGIWSQGGGNLALVARKGSFAPGTSAGTMLDSAKQDRMPNRVPPSNIVPTTSYLRPYH